MAEILSADEIDVLLSSIRSYKDTYIHKKSKKEYGFISEVINKTNDTIMVLYKDMNDIYYVRDKEDFFNKFIKKENNMACGGKNKSKKPKKK